MKALTLVALCVVITACASGSGGYQPRYYYSNIEIANLTGETLRNVKVELSPGGDTLECAELTNNRICDQRFAKRRYPDVEIVLSWESASGEAMSAREKPLLEATLVPSLALRVMMDINADGSVKFYMKQDDQFLSLPGMMRVSSLGPAAIETGGRG